MTCYNDRTKYELKILQTKFQLIFHIYLISLIQISKFNNPTQKKFVDKIQNGSMTSFQNTPKTYPNTFGFRPVKSTITSGMYLRYNVYN